MFPAQRPELVLLSLPVPLPHFGAFGTDGLLKGKAFAFAIMKGRYFHRQISMPIIRIILIMDILNQSHPGKPPGILTGAKRFACTAGSL